MEVARIEARRVGRDAGRLRLLTSVTLHALRGEVVALVGPSGAGKSTLLKCLNGYTPPETGSVLYGGDDLYADPARFRGAIGFVPQDDVVHGALTAHASLTYALRLRRPGLTGDEVESRVSAVLEQLDLAARRDTRVERLSGGQRKRVSLGMELVASPAVMFLDEPTSGLDPALEVKMMEVFRAIAAEGRIVVVTTHVMDSLAKVDQLAVLYSGQLAFFGPPARALAWFQVAEANALFRRLPERTPAEWAAAYADSAQAREVAQRPPPAGRGAAPPSPPSTPESALAEIERELAAMKEAGR